MARTRRPILIILISAIIIISGCSFASADDNTGDIILVDNDICFVSIGNFKYNNEYYAFTADARFINRTDFNLFFSIDKVSVNGYMCESYIGTAVPSYGESVYMLTFDPEDFDRSHIISVREIEFTLSVVNNDDWASECLTEKICTVLPFGEDAPRQAEQSFRDNSTMLVDNDDCIMIITGFETDPYFFKANVYLENKTDIELEFKIAGSTSINSCCISPCFYKDVMPGKKMNTSIQWYLSDLDLYGINEVNDIALDIVISDANNWFADSVYEGNSFISITSID